MKNENDNNDNDNGNTIIVIFMITITTITILFIATADITVKQAPMQYLVKKFWLRSMLLHHCQKEARQFYTRAFSKDNSDDVIPSKNPELPNPLSVRNSLRSL